MTKELQTITWQSEVDLEEGQSLYQAVNWNKPDDSFSLAFWEQNIAQFWQDKDVPISDDSIDWLGMSDNEKRSFIEALGGLTGLDTKQSDTGMPSISIMTKGGQRKGVLNFMASMESIHAKSYSAIFTTLMDSPETDALFEWADKQYNLQRKTQIIDGYYTRALKSHVLGTLTPREYYLALVASVFLETFLFYSGFFYPLYLSGYGRMKSSGEIISLIMRDEAIHGLYVGTLAQEAFLRIPEDEREDVLAEVYSLLGTLYENEVEYTRHVYDRVNLTEQVITYVQHNADRALLCLGLDIRFGVTEDDINPIVQNGIRNVTKNHDFFSQKGNGYVLAVNVTKIETKHFEFEMVDEFGDGLNEAHNLLFIDYEVKSREAA